MHVQSVKTKLIRPGKSTIYNVLDDSIMSLCNDTILVITSKIVSLCEGSTVPTGKLSKQDLVESQASYYLPSSFSQYQQQFTLIQGTLIISAGIDESNSDGTYVLWPKDCLRSAIEIRTYLMERFKLKRVGVVISDSTSRPLRIGTTGISLAHSGFVGTKSYIGTTDLFGKRIDTSQADIAGGIASAAVLEMGEGAERTPLCIISACDFIKFGEYDSKPIKPNKDDYEIMKDDLFSQFFTNAPWQKNDTKYR